MRAMDAFQQMPRRRTVRWWLGGLGVIAVTAMIGARSFFVVDASEIAVVTRSGRIVRGPITEAGPYSKRPWHCVRRADGRVRLITLESRRMLTAAAEPLLVQPYLCWRIAPERVERFWAATADGANMERVLRDVLWSALDEAVASHALSDWIAAAARTTEAQGPADWPLLEPVRQRCRVEAERVGVRIVDVGLLRIGRPEQLATPVAQALEAEGRLLVTRVELDGLAEAARVETDARRQADAILGMHLNEAHRLQTEGRQEAARIYAASYALNAELARVLEQLAILRRLIEQEANTQAADGRSGG